MGEAMTVAVTGASGFVGRYVVRELLSRGHLVRALARDGKKAAKVLGTSENVTIVTSDVLDETSATELLRGASACIHLVGIIREAAGGQTFQRLHVRATRALVRACERAGVRRLVHMSALGARPDGKAEYQRTKYQAEQIVRDSDLQWTVLRPSLIHGPDGEFVQLLKKMASGDAAPFLFMPYFVRPKTDTRVPLGSLHWESARVQPIAVQDVARCFAEALERPETIDEIYNLAGPNEVTWPQLYRIFRDELPGADTKIQPWHVPGNHAAAIAKAASHVGLGSVMPFDAGQALMAMEDSTTELEKVRTHFALSPRDLTETVRGYASAV
jgi:NADH dehydrogenase